ncbi:hypothetical protein MRS44_018176 [Fusarium solani]|uniref:uncharacterized protein n=1 Tax=Fusarium solani TaxID=169388 RepID=UPI0032C416FE|nr:hypothetical protein MRS44_018176 [Fusarium solani]
MADSNPDAVNLLRASLARWDQYLREVDEPDAVFQEKRNKISDRSKKRLEEFALNPSNDNIAILQQALLSDAREIERLELEHAAIIARKQKLRGEAAEGVAGRILGDLVDILGLPEQEKALPENAGGYKHTYRQRRKRAEEKEGHRHRQHQREKIHQDDTEAAEPKSAEPKTIATLQRSNAAIQKPCATQQSKDIRFGINGQAARIMVRWDPVRLLWVCAVHFPQGQVTPGLDTMMRRSVVPAFIRLVGRRQVANRLEHPTTASEGSQPSGGCHLSQSSGEEPNKNISNARQD